MSDLVIGINRTLQIISARLTPGCGFGVAGLRGLGVAEWLSDRETPQPRDLVTALVAPGRLERPTNSLGNCCSIHLSYGATRLETAGG